MSNESLNFVCSIRESGTDHLLYCPLLQEDMTFCELDECGDIASWKCYPEDEVAPAIAVCDRCKQELQRDHLSDDVQAIQKELKEIRAFLCGVFVELFIGLVLSLLMLPLWLMIVFPLVLMALLACYLRSLLER